MKGYIIRAIFKKYWKLLLSMLLVSAFGSATMTGLGSGYLSLKESLNKYLREGAYQDVTVTMNVANRAKMEDLLALPGVEEVSVRLTGDVMIVSPKGRYLSVRAMSWSEEDFQKMYFWEQADAGDLDAVYLEYSFANNNGIHAGDTFQVKVDNENRSYIVAGIVSRPESLNMELSAEISIKSDDFGFAYVPRELLEKETIAERRAALEELEEKYGELAQAKQDAQQEYLEAVGELDSAEAELLEKKEEFEQKRQELAEQKTELAETKEELLQKRQELAEKKEEAENGQKELNEKKAEAQEKEEELKNGQLELDNKRAELEDAEQTLSEQRAELIETRKEALRQAVTLQQTKEELLAAKEELELARVKAIDKRGDLYDTRTELIQKRDTLKEALTLLRQAKTMVAKASMSVSDAIAKGEEMASELSPGTDWERVQAELRSMLGSYAPSGTITEDTLDQAIDRVSALYNQADWGVDQVNDGLKQIREGLALADEKEAEINDGLAQIEEAEAQIPDGFRQIEDGFVQLREAEEQIAAGREEISSYQAQIDEGWRQLNDGLAQIADYQAQLDDGFVQIAEGEEEIANALAQIEDGETQIDEAIAEAQQQLADGENQLAEKRKEAADAWAEVEKEFSDVETELQKASDELSAWEGYEALCNQFLLRFTPDADPEDVLKDVLAVLEDAGVQKTVLFEDSPVKRRIDDNLMTLDTISNFVPVFFFCIALIVVYLFMALIIRQCRPVIGILRALGFSTFKVVFFFCAVGFWVSMGAVALGLAVSVGLRNYLCYYYNHNLFHLPVQALVLNWPEFFLSAGLTVIAVQLSTIIGASSISAIQPSEAMTRQRPSSASIPRILQKILRGASPFLKFSVISLFRRKLRFLFSAFCLAGSVVMIFSSLSIISSSVEILEQVFERCMRYDCQIFARSDAGDDFNQALAALPYVSDVENMDYYTADISANGYTESSTVCTLKENTDLVVVERKRLESIPISGDGIILERHMAEKLHAGTGDSVLVNGVSMPVAAISEQNGNRYQYVTEEWAEVLGARSLHTVICRVPLERENELMDFLMEREEVLYASFTHAAYSAYERVFLRGLLSSARILICAAIVIGMVIVVNTSQTNLLEQKRELCVLRTLGFQRREISRYWFAQSILHFLVSCVFGFPAGIEITKSALRKLEMNNRTYVFVNNPMDYVLTAVLVLGFIALSHFMTMHSLKKWDIVEVVKEKE